MNNCQNKVKADKVKYPLDDPWTKPATIRRVIWMSCFTHCWKYLQWFIKTYAYNIAVSSDLRLFEGPIFKPISYYIVGDLVKFFPFIPKRGFTFCNWENFSKELYYLIASWILSWFLTALNKFSRELTSQSLALGKGITLVSFPYFNLNNRSKLRTLIWEGFPGGNRGSRRFEIKGFPLNRWVWDYPTKGLFHFFPDFSDQFLLIPFSNSSLFTFTIFCP